ncbi:MAG: hypothetical protein Q9225_000945 [Loekoesia sp. 1 TL-2023]
MYHLGTTTLPIVLFFLGIWIANSVRRHLRDSAVNIQYQCREPPKYPHRDPILGLDLFWKYKTAFDTGRFLLVNTSDFHNIGKTFKAKLLGSTVIKTVNPEISKAVFSTSSANFGVQPLRYATAKDLWGNGIIVVDGSLWSHARALIRPSFDLVHIANLDTLCRHVDLFMTLLPRDGSTIDLLPLLKRLTLDTSSDFIFGESIESLSSATPTASHDFMESFAYAQRGTGIRTILGCFRFLHRDARWLEACRKVTDFCVEKVKNALARQKVQDVSSHQGLKDERGPEQNFSRRLRLIDEMAKQTQDPIDLRYQILNVFSPAHDGAAITTGNVFFHLARQPRLWANLRDEILPTRDEPLSYELLRSYRFLDYVLRERPDIIAAHRLTPVATLNQRICIRETVLPLGGGLDNQSPLFIRKGDVIEVNYRAMMRDKDFWGKDADEFRPERWEIARPTWEYTPFGGEPRNCPGMKLVYTESAYVVVRIAREFRYLENRDGEIEWKEKLRMTAESKNGALVGLIA